MSLPMVVRASALALRDLEGFPFGYVSRVAGTVMLATCGVGVWANIATAGSVKEERGFTWTLYAPFIISYMCVVMVATHWHTDKNGVYLKKDNATAINGRTTCTSSLLDDECRRKSLRFVGCLLGIYLHVPLLLANYSLGFPSSAFWSPLLATLVLPLSPPHRKGVFQKIRSGTMMVAKCVFLLASSPPVLFTTYSAYVLWVYTPLHLFLSALWLA